MASSAACSTVIGGEACTQNVGDPWLRRIDAQLSKQAVLAIALTVANGASDGL